MKLFLIIDDDDVDFMIHNKVISKAFTGSKVVHKNNVTSALEYLDTVKNTASEWPDYILLDINIPGMDGFQFLARYVDFEDRLKKKTKIFMLSSSENFRDINLAKSNPLVTDYLLKPLKFEVAQDIFSRAEE